MVSNLFGTMDRIRFLFRDSLEGMRQLIELRSDPRALLRAPWSHGNAARAAWAMRPRLVKWGPILEGHTTLDRLPQLQSWPADGGPFVTLPQIYSENILQPGLRHSNLGMYRVQLAGGQYVSGREVGLHYQLHRSIHLGLFRYSPIGFGFGKHLVEEKHSPSSPCTLVKFGCMHIGYIPVKRRGHGVYAENFCMM